MSVTVTNVWMPGMFSIKEDPVVCMGLSTYQPMSYSLGRVCDECWMTAPLPLGACSSWPSYNDTIRPVGYDGCSHEGSTP
jgi:hypothetical protein